MRPSGSELGITPTVVRRESGILVPGDLLVPAKLNGERHAIPDGMRAVGTTASGIVVVADQLTGNITREREQKRGTHYKWVLANDFSNTRGASRDDLSPNQMVAAFWEVRKQNDPTYEFEQPWFRDDSIHGLRPVNADYRAWHYSRIADRLNQNYVMTVVCDPGVGGKREGMVIKTKKGNWLVGPNNGIFGRLLENEGVSQGEDGRLQVWKFRQEKFDDIETATFHGEKAFAPVSAELMDQKQPGDLTEWLEPFGGEVVLNPLSGGFRTLVPEHLKDVSRVEQYIPGDHQMLLENDGVNLLRFDGQVPDYAVAARVIITDPETGEMRATNIAVGEAFVDHGPGTLMVYPGSDNPSGIKGRGLTEITASMAVHDHEPNAPDTLRLSPDKPLEIGHDVVFQWLREGDDLSDTSQEAILNYSWEDRGLPIRVLDAEGNVDIVYRQREQSSQLPSRADIFQPADGK